MWDQFLAESSVFAGPPSQYDGTGTFSVNVIWDWSTMSTIATTNVATGNYAAEPVHNKLSLTFSNNTETRSILGAPGGQAILDAGNFVVNGGSTANIQEAPEDIIIMASAQDGSDFAEALQDAFDASMFGDGDPEVHGKKTVGGLFVLKTGFMYTHNCGINDFWVETDMNLAYRDWEDVARKRHYDDNTYTDLKEMFHAEKMLPFVNDNYYFYDKSTSVYKFWGTSWAQIQRRYYDPLIAEECYIKYPKRLLYSAPSTGWIEKSNLSNKNDAKKDFWRVFLTENFRDFKSKVTTV